MKMLTILLLVSAAPLSMPLTAQAQNKPHAVSHHKAAHAKAAMYECPICHHKVDAAQAKSLHYVCPVDHGKLAPVKTASLHK